MSLTPDDEALLAAARAALSPSDEDRRRVRRALAAQCGSSLAGAVTEPTGPTFARGTPVGGAAAGGGGIAPVLAKLVAALLTLGVALEPSHPYDPSLAAAPSSGAAGPLNRPTFGEVPTLRRATAAISEARPPDSTARMCNGCAGPNVDPPVSLEGSLTVETRLVREARAARREGATSRALSLIAEHARRFPHGVLAEERDAERALTLCQAGKGGEAHKLADAFITTYPRSALGPSIRDACAMP